jgi:hypothetical protein
MAKRLGGVLLGFGVNRAGEFCISYNVRLGDMCARAVFPHKQKFLLRSKEENSKPMFITCVSQNGPSCTFVIDAPF